MIRPRKALGPTLKEKGLPEKPTSCKADPRRTGHGPARHKGQLVTGQSAPQWAQMGDTEGPQGSGTGSGQSQGCCSLSDTCRAFAVNKSHWLRRLRCSLKIQLRSGSETVAFASSQSNMDCKILHPGVQVEIKQLVITGQHRCFIATQRGVGRAGGCVLKN